VIARDDAEQHCAGRQAPAVDHYLFARAAQGDEALKITSELAVWIVRDSLCCRGG